MPGLRKKALFSAFFYALPFLPMAAAASENSSCPPVRIDEFVAIKSAYDGDTVRLKDNRRVRLLGINTPEVKRKNKPGQALAVEARDALRAFIEKHGHRAGLRFGPEKYDHYGRTLAHLYLIPGGDDKDKSPQSAERMLLETGLATAITTPPNTALSECYRSSESLARANKTGIWSLPQYQSVQSNRLDPETKGFRIIEGRLLYFGNSRKSLWLNLEGGLGIRIKNDDLVYFKTDELYKLKGKRVRIRGWVKPQKSKSKNRLFYMSLRHPDALVPIAE